MDTDMEAKTRKPTAIYCGGIQSLIEAAITQEGIVYIRFQGHDSRYGYVWGKWMIAGNIGSDFIPYTIQCGFSVLRKRAGISKWRLPMNANISKCRVTKEDCDCEEAKYVD
jgi:hypothetical protein